MIFATVGTQLSFPRLISALDSIAPGLDCNIVAQIGETENTPKNIEFYHHIEPTQFQNFFVRANVIVSHAGIGTILAAKKFQKPIILFPRLSVYGEHRNDHQVATVRQVEKMTGVYVAHDVDQLGMLLRSKELEPLSNSNPSSLDALRSYIRMQISKN